jgi:hypothetical protein
MDTPRLSPSSIPTERCIEPARPGQGNAIGTSTQSKEIDLQRRPPPALSGVYRIQSGGSPQYIEEGSDKRFRDRSFHVGRVPTHDVFQTHHTRASNDRQRRRRRRTQRPRSIIPVLPRMRNHGSGSLVPSNPNVE